MVKRKRSKKGGNQLSDFVVEVASGDMPAESVFRADDGKNPAADALGRMGKAKGGKRAPRGQEKGPGIAPPQARRVK